MSTKEKEFYLVQKALGGDQRAYTAIYKRYHDSLFYQLNKIVKDKDTCSDVTIETFEKAFEALHRYTPDYSFSTWLFRIGVNCAIDYVRKTNRIHFVRIDQEDKKEEKIPVYQLKDPAGTPNEQTIFKQRKEFIQGMIDDLPKCFKRILELRYIDDFTYDEIADEMNMPLGSVKVAIHRAKELLQWKVFKAKDPRFTVLYQI